MLSSAIMDLSTWVLTNIGFVQESFRSTITEQCKKLIKLVYKGNFNFPIDDKDRTIKLFQEFATEQIGKPQFILPQTMLVPQLDFTSLRIVEPQLLTLALQHQKFELLVS